MLLLPITRQELLKYLPKGGVVAEIGVWEGGFSKLIVKHTDPKRLHLIDPWLHQDDEDYAADPANVGNTEHEKLFRKVTKTFGRAIRKGDVVVHRDFSGNAVGGFDDGYFDWIYIDGLHTVEGVTADLRDFDRTMKDDALILGHDYSNQRAAETMNFGVVEAVDAFVTETDWEFAALTVEPLPTYLLARPGAADRIAAMTERLVLDAPGIVEIRDYPGRPFIHKTFDLTGRRGRTKTRVVPSF